MIVNVIARNSELTEQDAASGGSRGIIQVLAVLLVYIPWLMFSPKQVLHCFLPHSFLVYDQALSLSFLWLHQCFKIKYCSSYNVWDNYISYQKSSSVLEYLDFKEQASKPIWSLEFQALFIWKIWNIIPPIQREPYLVVGRDGLQDW